MTPPFGLFRKKENIVELKKNSDSTKSQMYSSDSLNTQQAISLLQDIEAQKVKILARNLLPIKESVAGSLESMERVANNLEREDIKIDEVKFKSTVENSKRTVIASLRREVSSDLPLPQSILDVNKFKDRLESITDRLGEVSGSHSRVLNVFMKKHAGKLKNALETLSSLLKKTNSIIQDFEEENKVLVTCINQLNILSQRITIIKSNQGKAEAMKAEIELLNGHLDGLKKQLSNLESSSQFKKSSSNIEQTEEMERAQLKFHKEMIDLYGHISRALMKYSYGMPKDTLARLKVLTEEPWRVFDDPKEVSAYTSLLVEIRKAVESGKIVLKDSDKVLNYFDLILKSMPEHRHREELAKQRLSILNENKDELAIDKAKEIRTNIWRYENQIKDLQQLLDQLENQVRTNSEEYDSLLRQTQDRLFQITGKRYNLSQ